MLAFSPVPSGRAQSISLAWYTLDGGGASAAGGPFTLAGTIGQPDAGSPEAPLSGGAFELVGGFWPGSFVPCPGDANGDGQVNIADLGLVLSNFGLVGAGIPGDVDGNGRVDIADLGLVLAQFGIVC